MASDQEGLRKVGRGGAGNYYAASKSGADMAKDLERQDTGSNPIVTDVFAESGPATPVRAGRGGAGNFMDASQLPDEDEKERISKKVTTAVTSSLKKHQQRGGMGGRGGAGNWAEKQANGAEGGDRRDAEESKTAELEKKVTETVEKGLKLPDKVHHGREKNPVQ